MPPGQTWFSKIEFLATDTIIFSKQDHVSVISCQGGPLIAQSSGRLDVRRVDELTRVARRNLSKRRTEAFTLVPRVYRAACDELSRVVSRFVTALYGALS